MNTPDTFEQTMRSRGRSVAAMATASLRADRRRALTSIALDIGVGVSAPLMAVGIGMLVNAAVSREPNAVLAAVAVVAASSGGLLAMNLAADRMRLRLEENVAHYVETEVAGMVTGLPGIAHHENPKHIHRVDRLLEESWMIAMAVPALISAVGVFVRFFMSVGILGAIDRRLLLLPLTMLPTMWAGGRAERIRLRALEARAETGRVRDELFWLIGRPEVGGELRTFGVGERLIRRHQAASEAIARDERDHRMAGAWWLAVGRLAFAAGFGVALLVVAARATAGDVSVGALVMVIVLTGQIMGQAGALSGQLNWVNWVLTGVRHYVWLLDYDASHRSAGERLPVPDRLVSGIRFEDVTFAYPQTGRTILQNVDLSMPAGSVVAIVGDNGAGKTTLIKLLLRFYEPTSGRITLDGVPLSALDPVAWRAQVTAALQDHARPELLVGESIGIGGLEELDDAAALAAAASRSGADQVVEATGGWDVQLGVEWEGGTELSGGQWQRLAVGRSAMRTGPLLLVLDEPTAALDPEAEQALFEQYAGRADSFLADRRRERGAVTVVVSHRLSTVRMADLIVVLEGTRIIETGTHDDLLAAGGRYAELFRLQASAYQ